MVFLPAVMFSFMGTSRFDCGPVIEPPWEEWTLGEFETRAAKAEPKLYDFIAVHLKTPSEADKLDAGCFASIAKVLNDNAGKKFSIDMGTCEFKDSTITSVPERAFENCNGQLLYLYLPPQITHIGKKAFAGFTKLGYIVEGYKIEAIGDEAYKGCTGIWYDYIPDTVTTMGKNVFEGWTSEQRIKINFEEGKLPDGWDEDWDKGCDAIIKYKGEW